MNPLLLELLCCPKCQGNVSEKSETLICEKCAFQYNIIDGIPVMVDLESIPAHLVGQIEYFEKEDVTLTQVYKLDAWQKSYVTRFRENFSLNTNDVVLDCGTGSGYMAIELASAVKLVIACDLTLHSLVRLKNIAQENGITNILLVCCSAEELPFKNACADYFISNAVLEHLPREKEAILEINRVTKPKSGVMAVTPILYKYLTPFLIPVNMFHDHRIGHLRRYDEQDYIDKFPEFRIKKLYYTGHYKKVVKTILNRFHKYFDDEDIEQEDDKLVDTKQGASNIIVFLERP